MTPDSRWGGVGVSGLHDRSSALLTHRLQRGRNHSGRRLLDVPGDTPVIVKTKDGKTQKFYLPIQVSVFGQQFTISSSNHGSTTYFESDLEGVFVAY
jgi:hypothetical protein